MKRIAAFVFAFLAVWYLQATDADAQFRRECRAGFCVPGGGPSGNPISNACINSSGTTITFTAQGVGGANPTRVSVVSINWSDSTAAGTAELTAMTIGGITMTRAVRASGDNQNSNSEIWYAANPTGTSANVVATFSTAVDGITIEVYRLVGYLSVTAATTGTTSVSQAYTNKQLAIAAGSRTTNVSTSLSNMVNDYSSACGANLWGVHASQKLSGNGTLTSAISPTSSNPKIALAVWTAVPFTASCSQSTTFIARAVAADASYSTLHKIAIDAYICGLVTDGVFTKFDVLYVYATQSTAVALLNIVSTSYTSVMNGTGATFAIDRGYTGVGASSLDYINTQFNPTTAVTPNFTQNSAHISVWSVTDIGGQGTTPMGIVNATVETDIYPKYTDNNAYFRQNSSAGIAGVANASTQGLFLGNRADSTHLRGDRNGSAILTNNADSSVTPPNGNIFVLSLNRTLSTSQGAPYQIAIASIGSSFSPTDSLNYYNRSRTYMTAVGAP